ncbi:MAG TPA: hypothetical protein VFJ43_00670 [Bacteroidia bacterium]|nr:hypothetical protein [Bacteroidia bacterium]
MKWTLVSMTFARSTLLHYFSMLLYFSGTIFAFCWVEVYFSSHGAFSAFFPESFTRGQIDGISMPLAAGILAILLGIIFHFGLSGQLRVRKNENDELGIVYSSLTGRLELFPLDRVEFRQRCGFFIYRRVIIVSAVFFDKDDQPKLVIKEHSNSLYIIDKYYQHGGTRIPFRVPRKFGSVRTLKQLWMEKELEKESEKITV